MWDLTFWWPVASCMHQSHNPHYFGLNLINKAVARVRNDFACSRNPAYWANFGVMC